MIEKCMAFLSIIKNASLILVREKIPELGDFICNSYCVGLERLKDVFIIEF